MQREFFGYDSLKNLKVILDEYKSKNIFLVTGKKSFTQSGAEQKIKIIFKNTKYTQFNSFESNPTISDVKQGLILFKKVKPDLVIAIGGGSTIDIAKTINALAFNKGEPTSYITGKKKLEKQGLPLVAIPMTAGTGSEATSFATIYIDKVKYSLSHEKLILPTVSIVDPSLTESMPKYLTASAGMDALCQGIESIWSISSTKESRKYANEAVKIAFNTIEKAVNNPDKVSRLNMAKAANLSGRAINISKTTSSHSISYPITAYFGIPHGHAVALTIPEILEFNYNVKKEDCNDIRGVKFVKKRLNDIITLIESKDEIQAKDKIKKLMKKIGLETKLRRLNINKKDIELIVEKGFTANRMSNNPRKIKKEHLRSMLERIL